MSVQQKAGVVLPAACAVAASFDPALARSVGAAQGQAEVDPNIKRSPLCGRNFAMFSEDPHLTAALARKMPWWGRCCAAARSPTPRTAA